MSQFNDYAYHFLQPIQVKINNFNGYVCDLLQQYSICKFFTQWVDVDYFLKKGRPAVYSICWLLTIHTYDLLFGNINRDILDYPVVRVGFNGVSNKMAI